MNALLTKEEIALARHCLDFAMSGGASAVRITLTKSLLDLTGIRNGEIDKVAHALDRSMQFQLFAGGRFGTFSSNRMEREGLEEFLKTALETVQMLEPDACRQLPAPQRCVKSALGGQELKLYDSAVEGLDSSTRKELAFKSIAWTQKEALEAAGGYKLLSEEIEYSDSVFDSLTLDSQGLYARHSETAFEIGADVTIQDAAGQRYSAFWWDAAPFLKDLKLSDCGLTAVQRAAANMHPQDVPGGKYTLIVDTECASKLLTPVLNALGGYSLQQQNSFLKDAIGKRCFPENLSVWDSPLTPGETGCRLFDSEGVATQVRPIIDKGVVASRFINTYIAAKTGWEPTVEDATRVVLQPVGNSQTLEDLLQQVGDGILVTGFNGGNSNPATGNFSYGIEGFLVQGGRRVQPIREMLITGDFLSLWASLIATANDARPCLTRKIPSLAFRSVDFSA